MKLLSGLLLALAINAAPHSLYSDEDIVSLVILGEARGEGEAGMYAIACVIKQRMIERNLTARQVCMEPGQFVKPNRHHLKSVSAPYAIKLANDVTSGKDLDRKYINYANYFCTLKTFPDWATGHKPVKVIKHHKFFKL